MARPPARRPDPFGTALDIIGVGAFLYGFFSEDDYAGQSQPVDYLSHYRWRDQQAREKREREGPSKRELNEVADAHWQSQLRSDYWHRDRIITQHARSQLDRFAHKDRDESRQRWRRQGEALAEHLYPTLSQSVSPEEMRNQQIQLTGRKELL